MLHGKLGWALFALAGFLAYNAYFFWNTRHINGPELMKQVGEDQVALAKRVANESNERQREAATPEPIQRQQAAQGQPTTPPEPATPRQADSTTHPEREGLQSWEKAFYAVNDQQNTERARLAADRAADRLAESQATHQPPPPISDDYLGPVLRITGADTVPFEPVNEAGVEAVRHVVPGPSVGKLTKYLPLGAEVRVILRDPNPKTRSRNDPQNYVTAPSMTETTVILVQCNVQQ